MTIRSNWARAAARAGWANPFGTPAHPTASKRGYITGHSEQAMGEKSLAAGPAIVFHLVVGKNWDLAVPKVSGYDLHREVVIVPACQA